MAMFGKKDKKGGAAPPKAVGKGASPTPPKQPKPAVPPDIYTLLLGLSALFLIVAVVVLGLNYHWYQTTDPAVLPMSWAR